MNGHHVDQHTEIETIITYFKTAINYKNMSDDEIVAMLKKQKEEILQSSADADRVCTRMKQAEEAIENTAQIITEWNENAVRQIVERVTVLSADEVLVRIKGGAEIKQRME